MATFRNTVEIKLDALPEGEYMVLYSNQPDFKTKGNGLAYAFTTITNIAHLNRSNPDGTTDVLTLHRQSGDALAGVGVKVFKHRYSQEKSEYERVIVGEFVSDATGYIKIGHLKPDDYGNLSI
jgi:hypothetical protein